MHPLNRFYCCRAATYCGVAEQSFVHGLIAICTDRCQRKLTFRSLATNCPYIAIIQERSELVRRAREIIISKSIERYANSISLDEFIAITDSSVQDYWQSRRKVFCNFSGR